MSDYDVNKINNDFDHLLEVERERERGRGHYLFVKVLILLNKYIYLFTVFGPIFLY